MLIKQLLAFITVCLVLAGCRPGGCEACLRNETCTNGKCYPIEEGTICGEHRHSYADSCICDTGWIGENCQIDAAHYSGRYRFVGTQTFWHMSNPPEYSTDTIDEISELVFYSDTLDVRGKLFVYTNNTSGQTTNNYYVFNVIQSYINGANYGSVRLKKSSHDTIYYSTSEGGMGGGTDCSLRGIKLQ